MLGIEKITSPLSSPWILSHWNDEKPVKIPQDVANQLKNYQLMGVEFLYHSYRKKLKGAIINEEDNMNYYIQIAVFLNTIFNSVSKKFLTLFVCVPKSLNAWHYCLSQHGGLKVHVLTQSNVSNEWELENGTALLVPISDIKLLDLLETDFFSVIIEQFDTIANKRIFKSLSGDFNIGITNRSFYMYPDQKLQWTMLNWANPGCVGKLNDFYKVDNDNFENFHDNYRKWWFRLTWSYDEEFIRPTDEEIENFDKTLEEWSKKYNIITITKETRKVSRKRKSNETIGKKGDKNNEKSSSKCSKVQNNSNNIALDKSSVDRAQVTTSEDSCSSDSTIIQELPEKTNNYIKLPSMDETPILTSIIKNLVSSPEPIIRPKSHSSSKNSENESFFMSLFDNKLDHYSVECPIIRKQPISDGEMPCSSKTILDGSSSSIFGSLLSHSFDNLSYPSEAVSNIPWSKKCENEPLNSSKSSESQSILSQLLEDV